MARIEIASTNEGEYYFYLKSRNGRRNFTSCSFMSRAEMEKAIRTVVHLVKDEKNFQVRRSEDYEYYFVICDEKDDVLVCGYYYDSTTNLIDGIKAVQRNIEKAVIVDSARTQMQISL